MSNCTRLLPDEEKKLAAPNSSIFEFFECRLAFDRALPGALECADRVARFIAQFDVPRSLKDAGVPHNDIDQIAAPVLDEVERSKVVDRPVTREDIVSLLEAAYS